MIIPNLSYTYNSGTVNDLINDLVALGTANVTMVDLPFSSDEITAACTGLDKNRGTITYSNGVFSYISPTN